VILHKNGWIPSPGTKVLAPCGKIGMGDDRHPAGKAVQDHQVIAAFEEIRVRNITGNGPGSAKPKLSRTFQPSFGSGGGTTGLRQPAAAARKTLRRSSGAKGRESIPERTMI